MDLVWQALQARVGWWLGEVFLLLIYLFLFITIATVIVLYNTWRK